jgi:hypothetical protein
MLPAFVGARMMEYVVMLVYGAAMFGYGYWCGRTDK